jgi:hypothetical protein
MSTEVGKASQAMRRTDDGSVTAARDLHASALDSMCVSNDQYSKETDDKELQSAKHFADKL